MASVIYQEGQFQLSGKIDAENAQHVYQQGLQLIKQNSHFPVFLDLSTLEHGNTLALAVCIQWLRACPDHTGLKLKNVPDKMLGIIRASHLEQLLG